MSGPSGIDVSPPRFLLGDFTEVAYEHEGESVVSYQATVTDRETGETARNAVRLRQSVDDRQRVLGRDLLKGWAEEWARRVLHPAPLNRKDYFWENHYGDPSPCSVCDAGIPEIEVEESPKT